MPFSKGGDQENGVLFLLGWEESHRMHQTERDVSRELSREVVLGPGILVLRGDRRCTMPLPVRAYYGTTYLGIRLMQIAESWTCGAGSRMIDTLFAWSPIWTCTSRASEEKENRIDVEYNLYFFY